MKVFCVFGQHNYGNPSRGESYEYVNFPPAVRRLGHEVVFFESWNKSSYRDFAALNRELVRAVNRWAPDVVMFVLLNYEIWTETLVLLKEQSNAVLVNWAPDDSWKYEQSTRFLASYFDLHVTTYEDITKKAAADGIKNVIWSQWAASQERLLTPVPSDKCQYHVSFIGTAYGNRRKWTEGLSRHGIEVSCFGYGWERGPVSSERLLDITRGSVISLNFADSPLLFARLVPYRDKQIKARVFEIPGAGGFLLTQSAPGLDRFYVPDREVVAFQGLEDLVAKIRHYLLRPEERDRIAWAGHQRTCQEHTYDHRFRQLFAHIERIVAARQSQAGVRATSSEKWMAAAEDRHRVSIWLRIASWLVAGSCVLIFGRQRGRRAARRITYELCWRVTRGKTYSASGLPGRLFYKES